MRKYILQLLDKEVNQLKAILRKLEYKHGNSFDKKLEPVIEKTKTKLLTAEKYREKFISVNNCVSGNEATAKKIKESGEVAVCLHKEKGRIRSQISKPDDWI